MSSNNWPIANGGRETFRQVERRLQSEERRPLLRDASDFLGPGFGPNAILTADWSSEECLFNGLFYSDLNAQNSPDPTKAWIGQVIADPSPSGVQIVQTYKSPDWPPLRRMRKFESSVDGTVPVFTSWIPLTV